jgi:MYXO-CTERM domain-containing protein
MAVAANTARPGCDVNNTDPASPNQCYFQVDNAAELVAALSAIAGSISGETCDGIDNDCDGQVDEDLQRSCSNACGVVGTETCSSGAWGSCNAATTAERCDGVDNDCDGVIDEVDASLCPSGEVCSDGSCQPPNGVDDGAMQAGCACDAGGMPDAGTLAPFLMIGLVLLRRRRR